MLYLAIKNYTPVFIEEFINNIKNTTPIEFIAVFTGIGSVWLSKKENIWVFPVGLINTVFYTYLSVKGHLLGEASVNLYYTIMSIYGWILWAKRDKLKNQALLHITYSNKKEWIQELLFFSVLYIAIFSGLTWAKSAFSPGAIPWADAFASATAYTGMWLMAKKKVESWIWWLLTNISSIPLWYVKGYAFTSFQFTVLLIMAVFGLLEWKKRADEYKRSLL